MAKILEVKNLKVSYRTYAGTVQSVRGITFGVEEGETIAIVGESGCGKSVTAKTIMGLIQTTLGEVMKESEILYQGRNILEQKESEWEKYRGAECSMIFQDALSSLNPTKNIGKQIMENIINHYNVNKKEAKVQAMEMLQLVGIPDTELCMKKFPHALSGGMRQRVMIAIALAAKPKIIIADEPTTALDVTIQAQIIDLMKDIQKKFSTAIILITHDLGVVANIASHIIVMYSGKIVEKGTCEHIFYKHAHPYTWALLNAAPNLDMDQNKALIAIEGTPPDLIHPPEGCPFAERCKYCMNICIQAEAPEYELESDHTVCCWRYHPRSKKIDFSKEE